MRAAQAAASSGVAMGFAGGAGFATGAANFVDASGAFETAVAGVAAGAAGGARPCQESLTTTSRVYASGEMKCRR